MKHNSNPRPLRDERGFAMAGLLMVMLMLMVVGVYSVSHTATDTRITSHFDTGNRAFFAAESGVMHGLNAMNGPGVINFENEVVERWDEVLGTAFIPLPSDIGSRYSVDVAADPTDPRDRGRIIATGTGPLLSRRAIEITLGKSANYGGPPGAIHIAADDGVASQFQGNAFEVDGNNRNRFGALANDGRRVPGISTRNSNVANSVSDSLSNQQKDNVRGTGFSMNPLTPSVQQAPSPSIESLDLFVEALLSNPTTLSTATKSFNGNDVFGTMASPQVTHMTNQDVRINGNAEGSGILIVDGSLTINGNLDFTGLIIVRGETVINQGVAADGETVVLGNATILGSLWTGNLSIRVGGSAIIDYCHECLQLVDTIGGQSMMLPRPMAVVAWGEVL